jgi:DNA-binding transcriptional regulator YdaS (Cro superfamily)
MSVIEQAIRASGGVTVVAARLGVKVQRLCNWIERGVPLAYCGRVERATGGAVRRWHMRPKDWFCIWPELIDAEGAPPVKPRPSEREAA